MSNLPYSKRYESNELAEQEEIINHEQSEPKCINSNTYVNNYINSSIVRLNASPSQTQKLNTETKNIPDYEYLNRYYNPNQSFKEINEKNYSKQRSVSPIIEKRKSTQPSFKRQLPKLKYQKPSEFSIENLVEFNKTFNSNFRKTSTNYDDKLVLIKNKPPISIPNSNSDKNLIKYSTPQVAARPEHESILSDGKKSTVSKASNGIYLNMNETDSGRDSMSDSPISLLQANVSNNSEVGDQKPPLSKILNSTTKNKYTRQASANFSPKESAINERDSYSSLKTGGSSDRTTAAGAFTLKCILLSSGNSVTLEQSSQMLQQA